ncbi:hypothetical protein ACVDG3_16895 [Meridianimarinicoccus sp. RP-17]|uniref:hypothetical protein n=1 Tax=Meridianimarinicoccus zhengii TaxID=2056810 RepID=UPI000DAE47A5|nr:hypothetical protein [Phycocomes zhengii]
MANFLSPTQHIKLAEMLDKAINIPLVSNQKEKDIFLKLVRAIDSRVEAITPDEVLAALNSKDVTVADVVAGAMKDNLVPFLADALAFPFLPTMIKRRVLELVVDMLVEAAAQATTLDDKLDDFLQAT